MGISCGDVCGLRRGHALGGGGWMLACNERRAARSWHALLSPGSRRDGHANVDVDVGIFVELVHFRIGLFTATWSIFAGSPASGPALRTADAHFSHAHGSRLKTKDILRKDQENLDKIVTLKLEFQGPWRIWQDERARQPKRCPVGASKKLHLLPAITTKDSQETRWKVRGAVNG